MPGSPPAGAPSVSAPMMPPHRLALPSFAKIQRHSVPTYKFISRDTLYQHTLIQVYIQRHSLPRSKFISRDTLYQDTSLYPETLWTKIQIHIRRHSVPRYKFISRDTLYQDTSLYPEALCTSRSSSERRSTRVPEERSTLKMAPCLFESSIVLPTLLMG